MNEAKCVAQTAKEPTIDERLNVLLDLVHSTANKADSVFGKLFRDCEAPCVEGKNTPADCVESKIRFAIDKAEETSKTLSSILSQL